MEKNQLIYDFSYLFSTAFLHVEAVNHYWYTTAQGKEVTLLVGGHRY